MIPPIDPSNAVLVHFYRAVVSHADAWRQRMDATTNWAAATTAGMVTFAFGDPGAPHLLLLLAGGFDVMFLLMESRRYQIYDLWRRRFRTLNQYLIAPVLSPERGPDAAAVAENLGNIASDLGRTVPHLHFSEAIGYRLRRNYGYLFGAILLAWLAKLEMHPRGARGLAELVDRAGIGTIPGSWIMAGLGVLTLGFVIMGLRAPSEHMIQWTTVPSPADRLLSQSMRWFRGAESSEGGKPS
ncbi:MAG: DUF2270 domain-containing protein [Gemmatimonadaceae bacterium]|nr:DUF2270 domain-containing protein [Gemmatimonadaceae bacterium]MDQ3518491.1 DUF2270 domain-containing protein [Gemmatimonadota bacterium]